MTPSSITSTRPPTASSSSPSRPHIRSPGSSISFSDLYELHPLILSYLKLISPVSLLGVSKSLYAELLPVVYGKITLDKSNTDQLFYGYSPLLSSNSIGGRKNKVHKRFINDFPLPGRRSRSSPPDIISSSDEGSVYQKSRKSIALGMTKTVYLRDAESLSGICQVHMILLSYSPISTTSPRRRRSNEHHGHPWPLNNVQTLIIGWDLMRYLIDSHSSTPRRKQLPICCIPFENKVLVIEIRPQGGQGRNGLEKRYLRQAINELASEFTLEKLVFRVIVPLKGNLHGVLNTKEDREEHQGILDEEEEVDDVQKQEHDEEMYIPPIEHPPPAPEIIIILSLAPSKNQSEFSMKPRCSPACGKKDDPQPSKQEDDVRRISRAMFNFLQDTGRRNFKLPIIKIASPFHSQVENQVKRLIYGKEGGKGEGGVASNVGKRAFEVSKFVELASVEDYI